MSFYKIRFKLQCSTVFLNGLIESAPAEMNGTKIIMRVGKKTPVYKPFEKVIKEIEKTNEFPANKSRLCDWCEYRDICEDYGN